MSCPVKIDMKDKKNSKLTPEPTLFVCATPIGNLKDVSFRLIETLQSVDLILAEDTRQTNKLCQKYNISTRIYRYDQHSEKQKLGAYLEKFSQKKSIALVSDAGTPCINDPGVLLIHALLPK